MARILFFFAVDGEIAWDWINPSVSGPFTILGVCVHYCAKLDDIFAQCNYCRGRESVVDRLLGGNAPR